MMMLLSIDAPDVSCDGRRGHHVQVRPRSPGNETDGHPGETDGRFQCGKKSGNVIQEE
jgi:hypothetical protein